MASVYIIAEAGVNHNGSAEQAQRLIDAAKEAGADAVKFQTFRAEKMAAATAKQADYQQANMGKRQGQLAMLKELELSFDRFAFLKDYCDRIGIQFLSTAFDEESLRFLNTLDLPLHKIPSGEITNYPFLMDLVQTGKPLLLSTGMSTEQEVGQAVDLLKTAGSGPVCLLHCTSAYPAPAEQVNLRAMVTMGNRFDLPVGYSDHTQGVEVPVAAVALGACVVEKHFTLDRDLPGPDHKASITPAELAALVAAIRRTQAALGSGVKQPTADEMNTRTLVRKSIVAACPITKGETYTPYNLTVKRPGDGLSPMMWPRLLGRVAGRAYQTDEQIVWEW